MNRDAPVDILLVADDPSDLALMMHALERNSLTNHIQVARGGKALNFLLCRGPHADRSIDAPPKVVLLDWKLPLVDELDVLRQVKADTRTRTIPIVVLTSSSEERDVLESYQLGVNSYIIKPADLGQFSASVRQIGMYWMRLNRQPNC
jgi:two-component system, response regulator